MAYYPAAIIAPTVPQNFIPTNRVHSEFFLHGGPRLPVDAGKVTASNPGFMLIRYSDDILWGIKRIPSFEGELFWSSAVPADNPDGFVVTRGKASLYIAVSEQVPMPNSAPIYSLVWKPVVPSHFDTYIDPTTGGTWNPVGLYQCDPPHLCSG